MPDRTDSLPVVILCGGKGTRIRGVNDDVPKPMIAVGRHPILVHIMERYALFGHRRFVLCLGYLGDVICRYFGVTELSHQRTVRHMLPNGMSIEVVLVDTGLESMTGARVSQVRDLVADDFLLTYGDGVSDVNLKELLTFHSSHSCVMTLTAVRPPSRFGEVQVGEDGIATSFNEKPQASAGLISGGYFVCRRGMFEYLSADSTLVLEAEPMKLMVKDQNLAAYVHTGFWQCMDTYRDWQLLNELELTGVAPWHLS